MSNKTPLYSEHEKANARLVDFAGWDMPVQYESITAECQCVRNSAGIFDVSHMGRFYLSGPGAALGLSRLTVSRISDLEPGSVRYTLVCNSEGGVMDDVLVSCLNTDEFLVVVNASNREKLLPWFKQHLRSKDLFSDQTLETGMVAIQGPDSRSLVSKLLDLELAGLGYYQTLELKNGIVVSRTGYTGENGYEITAPQKTIPSLWRQACQLGAVPCGLGARDILRLEMGYPLYGHELAEDITPLQAGLKWVVHFDKPDFIGKEALQNELDEGSTLRRIGFQLLDRGIPRENCRLFDDSREIGRSTSGGYSPTLKKGFGLALVEKTWKQTGVLGIEIRGKKIPIETKKPPFIPKRANSE